MIPEHLKRFVVYTIARKIMSDWSLDEICYGKEMKNLEEYIKLKSCFPREVEAIEKEFTDLINKER